jgi:hypothetical protein
LELAEPKRHYVQKAVQGLKLADRTFGAKRCKCIACGSGACRYAAPTASNVR